MGAIPRGGGGRRSRARSAPESRAALDQASILEVVARIPRGSVATYGEVAARAGLPRRARLVGRVLSRLPAGSRLPWHRVVAAAGRIAFPSGAPGRDQQIERLRREGIDASRGRVDLRRHGWGRAPDDIDRWLWRIGDEN